jgi:hypothetical protein
VGGVLDQPTGARESQMPDPTQLDLTYDFILRTFVKHGQAPHFTDIGRAFGVSPDEGRRLLHDLMAAGLPNWLFPSTDLIASFAPFNNVPTHYRISIDGQQKWFAQCGLESLAMSWLFPDKPILVEAPCLDCGEPVRVTVRNGVIEREDPRGIRFYVDVPLREWGANLPFA